jgi:hypothetical protein
MPFIISKMSRSRILWILSLIIAIVSVWAGAGHVRVSAQKSDPVINKIYVRGTEPGTADQNSFIETFKVDAGSNGTDDLGPRDSAAPPLSPDVSSSIRISQVYTRGGEAGATYQNDFVEIFNAGSTAVDINNWALVVITFEGTTQQAIGARFNSSFSMPPGMHLLIRFNGNGTAGQATPGEFPVITDISLGSTSGQIMLLSPSQTVPTGCPTSFSEAGTVTDFVGYGTSTCFEGAVAPVPAANQSLTRIGGGCTDTDNNANDFALQAPNPRISTSALTPCGSTAPQAAVLNFSAAQYTVAENAGTATITVIRSGLVSVPVTVNFATANGTATAGSDYTAASGTLSFAANELQKTFNVPITDDSAVESSETVSLTLSNATGTAILGSPSSATLTIQDNDGVTPPPSSNSPVRISQIYTRGGEAGATYQNDFVEIFNAGSTAVNINGWALAVNTFEGTTQQAIGARFNSSFSMLPGMHLLIRFRGNGTAGQPVPGEFPVINDISLGSTSGQIMLLSPSQKLPAGCPASFGVNGAVTDFVGYGTTTCFEGAPAPVPAANQSLTRIGGGCTDTDNNANDFALQAPNPRISTSVLTPCGSTAPQTPVLNFSAVQYTVAENAGNATITVTRSGVVSVPVTVNFATANGTATAGSDYTAASGTLSFAANELQKTFNVPITDDSAVESSETVSLTLSNATGTAILGSPSSATLTIQDNDGVTPPPSSNSPVRISQIYTRGGEAGATYQNDFVEIFNAGSTAVNINGWALAVNTFEGTTQQAIGARFNSSFSMLPGMHLLIRFRGNGTAGQPVPGEFPVINDISLGSTSGQIMLLSPSQKLPAGCPASFGVNGAVTDFVGYGTTTCFEGAPAPVPAANQSLTRIGGGCTDTDNNANDFALQAPNPRISTSALTPCGSSAPQPLVNFATIDTKNFSLLGATTFEIIKQTSAFVDQHYHDFLNRFPDASGLQFWVNNIESCGSDVQCRELKRIDTSAAFFLSIEFQKTGYLVERFYKVGYGDGTGTSTFGGQHQLPVPIVRKSEFLTDTLRIGRDVVVLAPGWEQLLKNNKEAYALEFVQTTRFTAANAFPTTMTPAQFVDKLNLNTGNVLSATARATAINLFGGAANSSNVNARALAVSQVAEDTDLYNAEFNRAFVLTQYFGYLQRNPNDGPDPDHTGYDFWLTKLNQFGGDYHRAEMVKAFLNSSEYRARVGQ